MFMLQVLSIWYIHFDGKDLKWNKGVLKWKDSKHTSLCYAFIIHNETLALKAWKLTGFVQFIIIIIIKSFFLPFPVHCSPNIANISF